MTRYPVWKFGEDTEECGTAENFLCPDCETVVDMKVTRNYDYINYDGDFITSPRMKYNSKYFTHCPNCEKTARIPDGMGKKFRLEGILEFPPPIPEGCCEKCRTQIPPGANCCPKCFTPVPVSQRIDSQRVTPESQNQTNLAKGVFNRAKITRSCRQCGNILTRSDKACPLCGARVKLTARIGL